MCGRFVGYRDIATLRAVFPIDEVACEHAASFNVAPRQEVLAIVRRDGKNRLDRFHWGLVPSWAGDLTIGNRLINARMETVAEKPSFRGAFRRHRCLILADGFFEWTGPRGRKQPYYVTLPDEAPFAFAGLWEIWDDRGRADAAHRSCAIITTKASPALQKLHHRMPVILKPEAYATWLDPAMQDADGLREHMERWLCTDFSLRPVSQRVNTTRNNSPDLIAEAP